MYTAPVTDEANSREIGTALSVFGGAAILWALQLSTECVASSNSGPSGTFILLLVVGGFVLCLVGLVMWSRWSDKSQQRRVSSILLVIGGLTFCVAMVGHVFITFITVAIPSLLLGIVVRLVPGKKSTI